MPMSRETLDAWLPTVVQYAGVVLAFLIAAASVAGHIQDVAPLGVLALGMMLYKGVRAAATPAPAVNPPDDDLDRERWSHMP